MGIVNSFGGKVVRLLIFLWICFSEDCLGRSFIVLASAPYLDCRQLSIAVHHKG